LEKDECARYDLAGKSVAVSFVGTAAAIVADYIEYKLGYWCPRQLRYDQKWVRNGSTKGCDVLGFRFIKDDGIDANDELFVFESKAALTGPTPVNKLQVAIDDSNKDILREAATLNALKQRFLERGEDVPAKKGAIAVIGVSAHVLVAPSSPRNENSDLQFRKPFLSYIYQWLTSKCCRCVASISLGKTKVGFSQRPLCF
jgi:hypothetical protein